MNEDEEFFAWLDGELDEEASNRVAARVAASPELTARAERHRRLAGGLRRGFDPVLADARAAPRYQTAQVIDFGKAMGRRGWISVPQWAAMAASLVVGLVIGTQIIDRGGSGSPVRVEDGRLVASSSLDRALETRLASAPASDGPRIGLTFRDASRRICRSFSDDTVSGLACRAGDGWRIRGIFPAGEGQAGDYRMAAGEDPRLSAMIDETIAGEPFDARQEQAARQAGWR